MEKVDEFREKLKGDFGGCEEKISRFACNLARILAKEVLKEVDDELMQERDDGMKVVTCKEHWLTTI